MPANPFPKSPIPPKHRSPMDFSKSRWLTGLALALAVVALFSSALVWQRTEFNNNDANEQLTSLEQSVKKLQVTVQQNRLHVQTEFDNSQKNIDQLLNQHDTTAQQAFDEAAYLVRLASLHLTLGNDLQTTLKLLHMAKERLSLFHTQQATKLSQAINHDITLLHSLSITDINDIWTQINALSEQIAKLPIRPEAPKQIQSAPQKPNDPLLADSSLWDKIKHALASLRSLVVIHHFDKPVTPLLSPEQLLYLRENIQLKLSQAQWAALYRDESLYQQSLNIAADWMGTYDQNQNGTKVIIKKLKELAVVNIAAAYPNQLKSMMLLQNKPSTPQKNKPLTKTSSTTEKAAS